MALDGGQAVSASRSSSAGSAEAEFTATSAHSNELRQKTAGKTACFAATRTANRPISDTGRPPSPRFARGNHERWPSRSSGGLEVDDQNPGTPMRSGPSALTARADLFGSWQVFRLRVARSITFPPDPLQVEQWLCFRSTVPGSGTNPLRRRARGGIGEKPSPHLTSLFTRPTLWAGAPTALPALDTRSRARSQARPARNARAPYWSRTPVLTES